jgi:hypothetical protein
MRLSVPCPTAMQQLALQASRARAASSAATGRAPVRSSSLLSSVSAHPEIPYDDRQLLRGIPDRHEALKAQLANLNRFVRDNASEYAALEYHPWTRATRKFGVSTSVAVSTLPGCRGLLGVLLQKTVDTRGKDETPLVYYPGLLMTESMHARFSQQYHCPTSLALPSLVSVDPVTQLQQTMLIVGDPTAHGAIINDGVRSGFVGQSSHQRHLMHHDCAFCSAHHCSIVV